MEMMKSKRYIVILENVQRAKRNRRSYSISIKIGGAWHFYDSIPPHAMKQLVAEYKNHPMMIYDDQLGEFIQ